MFKQYDIVQIITTKRIKYLSGQSGQSPSPHGNWSIVGFIESDAMIAKESTLVRVPISDIRKVASLNISSFEEILSKTGIKTERQNNG